MSWTSAATRRGAAGVLDPEQKPLLHDHYIDVEFDLSSVSHRHRKLIHTIPQPLQDRM